MTHLQTIYLSSERVSLYQYYSPMFISNLLESPPSIKFLKNLKQSSKMDYFHHKVMSSKKCNVRHVISFFWTWRIFNCLIYLWLHAQEQNLFKGDNESVSKLKVEFTVSASKKVSHQSHKLYQRCRKVLELMEFQMFCTSKQNKFPKQRQKPTYEKSFWDVNRTFKTFVFQFLQPSPFLCLLLCIMTSALSFCPLFPSSFTSQKVFFQLPCFRFFFPTF